MNEYATGTVELPQEETPPAKPGKKEKKKKRWGLFGRKKRVPDFDENEDDIYYGIQLKPIDEYRMGYDPSGELTSEEETYKALFDDSKKAIDSEVEENFQRLQRERRRRVAEAVQTAGVDEQQVADEFGVVAPMPVTSFAADPYARQHGIAVEGGKRLQEDMTGIQKAMLETSADQTMEIKLNVLNDTVELQRVGDMAPVSEEAIGRVLDSPAPLEPDEQPAPPAPGACPPRAGGRDTPGRRICGRAPCPSRGGSAGNRGVQRARLPGARGVPGSGSRCRTCPGGRAGAAHPRNGGGAARPRGDPRCPGGAREPARL